MYDPYKIDDPYKIKLDQLSVNLSSKNGKDGPLI